MASASIGLSAYSGLWADYPSGPRMPYLLLVYHFKARLTGQRVISSAGLISPRGDSGLGVARQRGRLEAEGVTVVTLAGSGGEKVSLAEYGWFPETLE